MSTIFTDEAVAPVKIRRGVLGVGPFEAAVGLVTAPRRRSPDAASAPDDGCDRRRDPNT